jgi:uncharacterized membrane protein YvbJ
LKERKVIPHCPKCDSEVDEKMVFCSKCGAPLRMEQPANLRDAWRTKRREWTSENVNVPVWNKSFANFLRIVYAHVSLALALFSGLVIIWAMSRE